MKRFTQLGFVMLLLVLMVSVSVVAAATVNTSVVMAVGGGNAPSVLAKWETEPVAASLESGDPTNAIPGSQFLPPAAFNVNKSLNYYAVVTDPENNGNLQMVYADVYHPDGTFKYQIHFTQMTKAEGIAVFNAATPIGLLQIAPGANGNAPYILNELGKETAAVWVGSADIHYCQMDGLYSVGVRGIDRNQNPSAWLNNTFLYVPVTAAEYDFTAVNYGSVSMGSPVWRAGDVFFVTGDGKPTVRNVGNTKLNIKVNQSDMGFGKDVNGVWNVMFDARLGHTSSEPLYEPFTDHVLLDTLDRSHTDELDFSIHVLKGFDSHSGTMTLSTVYTA
jgi:hypothetical protein